MTGLVLLLLLAAEGVTLLSVHQLIGLHFFLGMLIIGPAALKVGSTVYRFARYYSRSQPYVRKGPPALILRIIGPFVVITSAGVLGTGVALALTGPHDGLWLLAHKAFFVLWFAVMTIHVLWYAPQLPRLLSGRGPAGAAVHRAGGRGARARGRRPAAGREGVPVRLAGRRPGGRAGSRDDHLAPGRPLERRLRPLTARITRAGPPASGSPEGAQYNHLPLVIEDHINGQSLAVPAKGQNAHVGIGSLPVIGISVPGRHLQHSYKFGEERERVGWKTGQLAEGF